MVTWSPVLLVFNDTLNNVSGITYHMAFSFIGVLRHFQQCLRYNVEHGDQFYWWKKPKYAERTTDHGQVTGKLYPIKLVTMFYVIPDTLLKVS
jgi:hypothetical protein